MRILWKSAYPGMPTGYGQQSALILPRLKALGHELAVSVTFGQIGHTSYWNGIPVFGASGYTEIGEDTVGGDYERWNADLVITFMCTWITQHPPLWRNLRTVHLMNVDCAPMSWGDYAVIADTGGMPAATSRRGWEIMRAGGKTAARPDDLREPLDPLYLPHGIDLQCYAPASHKQRAELRTSMNLGSKFVVGMNFHNNDRLPDRKNIARQLRGFAMFHEKHPESVLLLNAVERLPDGWNLPVMLAYYGLKQGDGYEFTPGYELVSGQIPPTALADWYRVQDVYLGAGNEGFGLPGLEAQACGTPAILLDAGSGPELAGEHNWLVTGDLEFNEVHRADWLRASAADVVRCLEEAFEGAADRREAVREHAAAWDINRVVREHWEPALAELA
jgi:glycosyltransferase involved in cell wall biosynthesis